MQKRGEFFCLPSKHKVCSHFLCSLYTKINLFWPRLYVQKKHTCKTKQGIYCITKILRTLCHTLCQSWSFCKQNVINKLATVNSTRIIYYHKINNEKPFYLWILNVMPCEHFPVCVYIMDVSTQMQRTSRSTSGWAKFLECLAMTAEAWVRVKCFPFLSRYVHLDKKLNDL